MPLIVSDTKGIPVTRQDRIKAAVEAGGRQLPEHHEGWISGGHHGNVRVLITGPQGFERVLRFHLDEEPMEITRRVKETLEA